MKTYLDGECICIFLSIGAIGIPATLMESKKKNHQGEWQKNLETVSIILVQSSQMKDQNQKFLPELSSQQQH